MKVSVAIPAYKAQFLKDAIESVLSQSYRDFELIIVNDKSPEDISSIVRSFSDSRIRYYENEVNLGKASVARAWNKCLEYARGEYFVLFSDDDLYEPGFLGSMLALAEKYPEVNMFHSRVGQIDESGKTLRYTPTCPEWESGIEFIWHRLNNYRVQYAPDFLCRTSALRAIGGFVDFPLAWGTDDATWFSIAINGGVGYVNSPLCHWRVSGINISASGDTGQRLRALVLFDEWLKNFLNGVVSSCAGETDRVLLQETRKVYKKRIDGLKAGILTRSGIHRPLGGVRVLREWMRYRKSYALSYVSLLKAFGSVTLAGKSKT